MGCFLEILLWPVEMVLELILGGYLELMQLVVPNKFISKRLWLILKITVLVFSIVIFVIFILGLLAAIFTEATVFELWKLIFIPLGIIIIQILLGVVVRCITKNNSTGNSDKKL